MFYHLITTNKCNLNCLYCSEKAFYEPDEFPEELEFLDNNIKYSIQDLKKFINNDPDPVITFYGGEPLLNCDLIKNVMDNITAKYMIQTNGILLRVLPTKYIHKFHTILVSIDGSKSITNKFRGKNVYEQIMKNLNWLKEIDFKGEIIARMTIEDQNVFTNVKFLLKNCDFCFKSIHWQLDANFWFNDWKKRDYKKWVKENYIPNLKKLISFWIKNMESGCVLKLYPFIGVTHSLMFKNDLNLLKCGSGHSNFTIQNDGNISPCPIMVGMKKYYAGNIFTKTYKDLKKIIIIPKKCESCKYYSICGGRCLYSNILNPWPENESKLVCLTIKTLIKEINSKIPIIKKLIKLNIIKEKDFLYNKYNGCEIIP